MADVVDLNPPPPPPPSDRERARQDRIENICMNLAGALDALQIIHDHTESRSDYDRTFNATCFLVDRIVELRDDMRRFWDGSGDDPKDGDAAA